MLTSYQTFTQDLHKKLAPEHVWHYNVNDIDVANIVSGCIAPYLKETYFKMLETSPYSVAMDEGTAKGNITYLAVNARFFTDLNQTKSSTKLLGLIDMSITSSGEKIYEVLEAFLFSSPEGEARKNNTMGVSTDHTTNMTSSKDAESH